MIDSLFHAQTHAQQQAGPKKKKNKSHTETVYSFVSFFSTFNSKSVT